MIVLIVSSCTQAFDYLHLQIITPTAITANMANPLMIIHCMIFMLNAALFKREGETVDISELMMKSSFFKAVCFSSTESLHVRVFQFTV